MSYAESEAATYRQCMTTCMAAKYILTAPPSRPSRYAGLIWEWRWAITSQETDQLDSRQVDCLMFLLFLQLLWTLPGGLIGIQLAAFF